MIGLYGLVCMVLLTEGGLCVCLMFNWTGLGNIMDAMKKAQEFTSVAKDLQEQLKNTEIEASVRDGQVKVTMTAQQVPLKVEVSDDLVTKGSAEVSWDVLCQFWKAVWRRD